jgi:hypothetical protein
MLEGVCFEMQRLAFIVTETSYWSPFRVNIFNEMRLFQYILMYA